MFQIERGDPDRIARNVAENITPFGCLSEEELPADSNRRRQTAVPGTAQAGWLSGDDRFDRQGADGAKLLSIAQCCEGLRHIPYARRGCAPRLTVQEEKILRGILLAVLSAAIALGQNAPRSVDRVFQLTNPVSVAGSQELLTILRTVSGLGAVTFDAGAQALSFSGTAAQVPMAEWLLKTLDQPVKATADELRIRSSAMYQYAGPGKDDVVRVFFLENTPSPRGVQELLTSLRTVADIRYIFNYTGLTAIALRGTAAETQMAAWLIHELDDATPATGSHKYESAVNGGDVVRVFYLPNGRSGELDAVLGAVRTRLRIQKGFYCSARSALIFRGTEDQLAAAEKAIAQA